MSKVELIADAIWQLSPRYCPHCQQELEPQVNEEDIARWLADKKPTEDDQILCRFFRWADELIGDFSNMPFPHRKPIYSAKIEALQSAKINLQAIIEEKNGNTAH